MNFTSIEQSKKLLELGLNPKSADMFWQSNLNSSDRQYLLDMGEEEYFDIEMNFEYCSIGDYDIPAWSLGALLEMMPIVLSRVGRFGLDYTLHTTGHKRVVYSHKMMVFHKENGKNLIEAAYKMVVWLLENSYI